MIHFEKDEKLIAEVRRHWFVIFAEGFVFFLAAIGPIVLYGLLRLFIDIDLNIDIGGNLFFFIFFIYLVYVLAIWIFFFIQWTDYYLDVWYITDKRIIDVEQKGLFRREIITIKYNRVQDVTTEVSGVLATILNFGDVHVQSAGIGREIMLKSAASPDKIKKIIVGLHNEASEKVQVVRISKDDDKKND